MKLRIRMIFAGLMLLAVSLACAALADGESSTPVAATPGKIVFASPSALPTPVVTSCPAITDETIRLAVEENSPGRNLPRKEYVYLVQYTIAEDELDKASLNTDEEAQNFKKYQADRPSHEDIWQYFGALIPPDQRDFLTEFIISTDGRRGLLAAVRQTDNSPEKWALVVDIADTSNPHELTYTLIHEYGHLLTLSPTQVPPSLAVFKDPTDRTAYFQELAACFTYFTGEGCSEPGSYIDNFYNGFWLDIYDEWNKIEFEPDEEEYVESMEAFYAKYQDRFVTDYAVTRPVEDIAESFAFFILSQKPAGNTIAEQKTLFFYDYPELVELREEILKNVCQNFPQ